MVHCAAEAPYAAGVEWQECLGHPGHPKDTVKKSLRLQVHSLLPITSFAEDQHLPT